MKVLLPSAGVTGIKFVNLGMVTYHDMKKLSDEEQVSDNLKNHILSMATKTDISKITNWDRDYLFIVLINSMRENVLEYHGFVCPCGRSHSHKEKLENAEVFDLPKGTNLYTEYTVNGVLWKFKLCQVEDETFALELCMDYAGEFEQVLYDNIILSRMLKSDSWEIDYATMETFVACIMKLPQNVYMAAHMFKVQSFHGIPNIVNTTCPGCGKTRKVALTTPGDVAVLESLAIMELYAGVTKHISYTEFLGMSVVDHLSFINSLNAMNGAN